MDNPVMGASGCFGYGAEMAKLYDINRLGSFSFKGTTLHPRAGNPVPRVAETACGMLNAIGLQNPGVHAVIAEELPRMKTFFYKPVMANVSGFSLQEYVETCRLLDAQEQVGWLEVNVSCPNVELGGMTFGTQPALAARVTAAVKAVCKKPVLIKLSPNVTDIVTIARAAEEGGADGLSLINTLVGMAIDVRTRRSRIGHVTGGLSGPAIRPIAVRMIWQVARAVRLPIIGMGGVQTGEDAAELMLAGAAAVAVGTASFIRPAACLEVLDGLAAYCRGAGVQRVAELTGAVRLPGHGPAVPGVRA